MSEDQLFLFGFMAIGLIGGITYLLILPLLAAQKRVRKRIKDVMGENGARMTGGKAAAEAAQRKRQVADSLKVLDERRKSQAKVSLRTRLDRAGLAIEPKMYWMASAACGAALAGGMLVAMPDLNPVVPAMLGVVGAFGLPRFILSKMIQRRQNKFLADFANAIDIIVRGVKSGLPLNECLNIIARESPEPLCNEFKIVVEQQRLGVTMMECFERMMGRVPLQEVRFFGIVIGIQQQAGGNLSEALGNLSGVLRDRKRLAAKVQALSAEAKASAGVLASLPFIVMLLVYITTPAYIALLWQKTTGHFMLACSAFWMSCGIFVMRKMINFKY